MKRTMSRTRIRTEKCPWMAKMPNELSDNTSIAVSKAMSVARLERLVWIHSDLGKSEGSVGSLIQLFQCTLFILWHQPSS